MLRRLFLPAAQKDAGRVAPLLLLPEKGLARLAYSLVNALVYGSLPLTTFFGQGQGHSFLLFAARFCTAKWAFFKLPSTFSGESPERSVGDLPSPAKSLAAPSLFAYQCAHDATACYQLFADEGKGFSTGGQVLRCPPPSRRRAEKLCAAHPLVSPASSGAGRQWRPFSADRSGS